ncbi:MAG: hypothetical protein NWQ54_01195 [Paraglaciecola sp.]|uniref:hypothetical protein n=1 Tax=Paraglaciecola sp. TaxID=1920173 RepID=UPI00273FE873|nr:hypothetical protein [Paraglaciecola sp.]MDP5031942.1 hypothetical protein [Paraglaciecola sp.]MDP5039419.1 hypothetical protein [Paraglaciecola sp.]MDP5129467.1 hypothetical protein [Paraglaciecola sp.]
MKTIYCRILVLSLVISSATVIAQEKNNKRGHKPPPEAIAACEGKSAGDTVSFETPRGDTLEGTCQKIDEQLVAVPANGERPPAPKKD